MHTFTVDASSAGVPFPHYWELCVGSCHAPLGLREDWRRQLRQCHAELGFRYVRFHGLLCDDMSVCADNGNGVAYSFFNIDSVFDFILSIGMRPFVELSFMPSVLASGTQTIFYYRGNVTPPRDYAAWGELVRRLVQHWVERYGRQEVQAWFFEVWNEPNLGGFWAGSQDEYFRLYRAAAEAIKAVDTELRVGGPASANNAWIPEMRAFCEDGGVPLDFISTHHYPTDAAPGWEADMAHIMGSVPRGVLKDMTVRARREAGHLPLYYTEWNCSAGNRTPQQDESYSAAFVTKTIVDNQGLVDGYSFWTFSDIFEEGGMPSQPFHGGFGLLALHGVPKPAYRAFQLLHRAGDRRLPVGATAPYPYCLAEGDGLSGVSAAPHPTLEVLATRRDHSIQVLLYNHNVPLAPIAAEAVHVALSGLTGPAALQATVLRIDNDHANPKRRWQELGSPEYPNAAMVGELLRASELRPETLTSHRDSNSSAARGAFDLTIPPHGVAALEIELT